MRYAVRCACGCGAHSPYPVEKGWVDVLFSDNGQEVYCLDRKHFLRYAEGVVNLWLAGQESDEANERLAAGDAA